MPQLSPQRIKAFQRLLAQFFATHQRAMPWRQPEPDNSFDPYKILVSEMMLQQTQVSRVIPKFENFITAFPDVQTLAEAPFGDVLRAWQGLGYNRRAKFLWQTAQKITAEFSGAFPTSSEELQTLPGIGPNTAGAILTYAFNQPNIFVETNVRTVYIHIFLKDQTDVSDAAIKELLAQTLPQTEGKRAAPVRASESLLSREGAMIFERSARIYAEPDWHKSLKSKRQPARGYRKNVVLSHREFYWALMDYGAYLKATAGNAAQASRHYARQSTFAGSRRQLRGQIIRLLTKRAYTHRALAAQVADDRLPAVLNELVQEGLIRHQGQKYSLG